MARETVSGPEGEAKFSPAIPLNEARAQVGADRAGERTRLRDSEGILKRDEAAEGPTTTEEQYLAALIAKNAERAQKMVEKGEKRDDILKSVADQILKEQLARTKAEAEALEKQHPLRKTFINKWRKHAKLRMAIGIGLTVVGVGAAATGLGGVAAVVVGSRAVMSAVGGYLGTKGAQEMAGAKFNRRQGGSFFKKGGEGGTAGIDLSLGKGDLAALEGKKSERVAQAEAMTSEERLQRMAALLSTEAERGRSDEQAKADKQTLEALRTAERNSLMDEIKKDTEGVRRRNLVDSAMKFLDHRVQDQLLAERQRLQHDKKVNRRRTAIAGIVGALAGTFSLVHGIGGTGGGSQHAENALRGGAPDPGKLGEMPHHSLPDITHIHPDTLQVPGHYPDVVINSIQHGETSLDVARKLGGHIVEVNHLNPDQHSAFVKYVAEHTTKVPGEDGTMHWHTSKKVLQQGLELARRS